MERELKNSQDALVDKICVSGFYITNIDDVDGLIKCGIVTIKKGQNWYLQPTGISSIHIEKTPAFDCFDCGLTPDGQAYSRMELSIPGDDGFHNLNCNHLWQYRDQIADALQFLETRFGISVCAGELRIQTIEINKTVEIDHPFAEYQRTLALLMHSFPGTLRLKERDYLEMTKHPYKAEDNERIIRTFEKCSGKRGLTVKVYDKTFQLNCLCGKDKLESPICGNYLRFEITLLSPEKVKDALGTNCFAEITDQMIQDYFDSFVEANVSEPYIKYKEKRLKAIGRILRDTYVPGCHTRAHDALLEIMNTEIQNHLPLMLDISDVIESLDKGAVRFKGRNRSQEKCNAKRRLRKVCREHAPTLANNDSAKYEELIAKLGKHATENVIAASPNVC